MARIENIDAALLNSFLSQTGQPLGALSAESPLLLCSCGISAAPSARSRRRNRQKT